MDGIAMGSPLGPTLANIFVSYYEMKLFSRLNETPVYFRYVDDTFVTFHNEVEADVFLQELNILHSSLNLLVKKNKKNVYHFWMYLWKELTLALQLVYIANLHLQDNTYVGNLSAQSNAKLV